VRVFKIGCFVGSGVGVSSCVGFSLSFIGCLVIIAGCLAQPISWNRINAIVIFFVVCLVVLLDLVF